MSQKDAGHDPKPRHNQMYMPPYGTNQGQRTDFGGFPINQGNAAYIDHVNPNFQHIMMPMDASRTGYPPTSAVPPRMILPTGPMPTGPMPTGPYIPGYGDLHFMPMKQYTEENLNAGQRMNNFTQPTVSQAKNIIMMEKSKSSNSSISSMENENNSPKALNSTNLEKTQSFSSPAHDDSTEKALADLSLRFGYPQAPSTSSTAVLPPQSIATGGISTTPAVLKPTSAPVSAPVSVPTSAPTSAPTSIPASVSTSVPTSAPTSVPTSTPATPATPLAKSTPVQPAQPAQSAQPAQPAQPAQSPSNPSAAANTVFFIITTSQVKYRGTLSAVDTATKTITFKMVQMLGTEDRVPLSSPNYVAPSNDIFEFQIFRKDDILKMTRVQVFQDPAIVSSGAVVSNAQAQPVATSTTSSTSASTASAADSTPKPSSQTAKKTEDDFDFDASNRRFNKEKDRLRTLVDESSGYNKENSFFDDLGSELGSTRRRDTETFGYKQALASNSYGGFGYRGHGNSDDKFRRDRQEPKREFSRNDSGRDSNRFDRHESNRAGRPNYTFSERKDKPDNSKPRSNIGTESYKPNANANKPTAGKHTSGKNTNGKQTTPGENPKSNWRNGQSPRPDYSQRKSQFDK